MAYIPNLSRVSTDGFRIGRNNPDGTKPTATRFLGFTGTVDLTAVLTLDKANMTIKVDGTSQTAEIDFTAAADITAVTVADAVTALNSEFTVPVITFSLDTATQRLKGVSASGTYVQVTGALAAALDFGQGLTENGNGLEIVKIFDDRTASIALAKSIVAAQEITQEGSKGTIDTVNIGQKLKGINPVLNINDDNYDILEIVEGGIFDRTNVTYTPPLNDKQTEPSFWIEIFSPLVRKGSVKFSDSPCEEMLSIPSCIGAEGDVGIESKSYAKYTFNITATGYTDESGVKHPAYFKKQLTKAEFLALDVENV
jgi:hypothetical protein